MKTAITGIEIAGENLLCLTIGGHDVMHLRTAYSDEITKPLAADQVQAVFVAVMAGLGFGEDGKPLPHSAPTAALRTARDLIAEAMEVHIYGDDDKPEPECSYTAGLREIDAALAVEASALDLLRRVLPYAESRAEDAQEDAEGYAAGSDLRAEAKGYADKATAAVDAAKAFLAGAPVAPDVNATMLAALRLALPICDDAYEDAKHIEENPTGDAVHHPRENAQSTAAALAAWDAVKAAIARAEAAQASQDGGDEDAGEVKPDAYEQAARAAGWQQEDGNIFHADRGEANGTGDPLEYADTWRDACDISKVGPDHLRMPLTSDIGFLIRDMIEGKDFALMDRSAPDSELIEVGQDKVISVDCSDADNLRVYTNSGALFVVRIIREG